MISEPSKRPFGHPVPASALEYFTHPQSGHIFETSAWGRDGNLYVSNCHIALRFYNFTAAQGGGPITAVDRLLRQPWHTAKWENANAWRKIDDCTLDLFKEGLFPMWDSSRGPSLPPRYRVFPAARINHGALVPVVSLQAVSRLPRCEIYCTLNRNAPIPIRFNGGDGLIARLSHRQEMEVESTVCHIFASSKD